MIRRDFQSRVRAWAEECFGEEIASDKPTRNYRFLEEALELVQSLGCSKEAAHTLVEYVYGRPVGVPHQEVGGVTITLYALAAANDLSVGDAGWEELARISTPELIEKIRAKQKLKINAQGVLPAQIETSYHMDSSEEVAVADDLFYNPMDTCPRGAKVLLLGQYGVATLGIYNGDPQWKGWFPLPKERK